MHLEIRNEITAFLIVPVVIDLHVENEEGDRQTCRCDDDICYCYDAFLCRP